jgi:hypothetical protein
VVAEAKLCGQPGVIEGAGEVSVPLAEVGPAVVVGRDDHGRSQDRGRGCRPDALQAQRAVPELARDAGGAGVQDGRVDGRGAPGDLGDGRDRGVVPRLREKPSMARFVFDEALRYESPVQTFFRTTTREVEVSGVRIPEGEKVLLFLGAAISVAGCGRPRGRPRLCGVNRSLTQLRLQ